MGILINELSLTGQFGSIGDFIGRGLTPFLSVISEMKSSSNKLYKKRDFWKSQLTATNTIHDVFVGALSRTNDEIRKSKSILANLIGEPFWEDSPIHNDSNRYEFCGNDILNSSLAESCERDKIVISFVHSDFSEDKLFISKNGTEEVKVDNLFDCEHYYLVAKNRGIIVPFTLKDTTRFIKKSQNIQGQSVYRERSTDYFWYLDNLHKNHYEVFDSNRKHIGEANMQGNIDCSKRVNGRKL